MTAGCPNRISRRGMRTRLGMTLVEILIAAAIAMILIFAVIRMFRQAADNIADGRSEIELASQIRRVGHQLREDLKRITVPTRPWPTDAAAEGYFEIYEGPNFDSALLASGDMTMGDFDDILMFTARSPGRPFVGRFNGTTIESTLAEIIWWTHLNDANGNNSWDLGESLTLYRRVLLIRPDIGLGAYSPATFWNDNDVSARPAGVNLASNSLADLTKRENRWGHQPAFPHALLASALQTSNPVAVIQTGNSFGDDVMLPYVTAFDVKVYDPSAPIRATSSGRALTPSDPAYDPSDNMTQSVVGAGAYVDLGYSAYKPGVVQVSSALPLRFYSLPWAKSQLGGLPGRTFCTWSSHYERDGIDQDDGGAGLIDEGTDGLDNNNTGGVDDGAEQETSPPYPFALRGIQIQIRVVDLPSQNVRQVTVQSDFTPE